MKELRLEHFRCYTDQTINFKPGINLLIGDNSSGKTSILSACRYVMSAFFSGYSDENTRWINPKDFDFSEQIIDGKTISGQPIKIFFSVSLENFFPDFIVSSHNTVPRDSIFVLQKNSMKNSRSLISGFKVYRDMSKALYQYNLTHVKDPLPLPLFTSFSTNDIHSNRKIDQKKFLKYYPKTSFGYYECLDGDGFFPYWIQRLLILQEGQKNLIEIEIVRDSIIRLLGTEGCNIILDMKVYPIQKKVYYILIDGREIEASLLSDGYKRLVNIVTDIAFRCAILNSHIYGSHAAQETKGVVLIDEIDLHLHPTLQANILSSLRHAFPLLQLIVSSHAPMVMSSVENISGNVIYQLKYSTQSDYSIMPVQTYGMDLSTISKVIFNQAPRNFKVEEDLERLFNLIDQEQVHEATDLLKEMQEKYGMTIPELSQAEAMLNCVNPDDDEGN